MQTKTIIPGQFFIGLSLGIVLLSILTFFYSKEVASPPPVTDSQTTIYKTIEEIPDCKKEESTLEVKTWKGYEDKYNNYKILIPEVYVLGKGPLQSISDAEYQKIMFRESGFEDTFFVESVDEGNARRYIGISYDKEGCKNTMACQSEYIKKQTQRGDTKILCKIQKESLFIKTQFVDKVQGSKNNSTNWITYVSSSRGVVEISFSEVGPDIYPFHDFYSKVVDSFGFSK